MWGEKKTNVICIISSMWVDKYNSLLQFTVMVGYLYKETSLVMYLWRFLINEGFVNM